MKRFPGLFLFGVLVLLPRLVAAQAVLASGETRTTAQERVGQTTDHRNQIAVEVGLLAGGLSYARRVGATPFTVGAGVWGAWEPPNSFDRNVWEPVGGIVFGRYQPATWFHADLGVAAARYLWADDCSDCSGTFVGLRSIGLAGYRFVFAGPEISVGRVSDARHGSDFGVLWGVQVRFLLGWGG